MSELFILYRNSFNSGDLLTMMPGMQKQYQKTGKKAVIYQRLNLPADYGHNDNHPIKDEKGQSVCMNEAMFKMLKPLIEAQEYVESFNVWAGEKVDIDFDLTRMHSQMPLPGGDIHAWPTLIFPQLECDLSIPWLKVEEYERNLFQQTILINRTERYRNPYITYHFLKPYKRSVHFVGTKEEHEVFCNENDLQIDYLNVKDFYELARLINACKCFIGGQSMCFHIADALKKKRILEVCHQYPNTFPTGANGHSFITQNALEYRFEQLLKETE